MTYLVSDRDALFALNTLSVECKYACISAFCLDQSSVRAIWRPRYLVGSEGGMTEIGVHSPCARIAIGGGLSLTVVVHRVLPALRFTP